MNTLSSRMVVWVAVFILMSSSTRAFDELGHPPADPPGTVEKDQNADNVRTELDQRLLDHFTAAAGTSPRLTASQAKTAGWGFIADRFTEIDRNKKGYVTFEEIQAFLDARSPTPPPERVQGVTVIK